MSDNPPWVQFTKSHEGLKQSITAALSVLTSALSRSSPLDLVQIKLSGCQRDLKDVGESFSDTIQR